jgi:hypothetical protein
MLWTSDVVKDSWFPLVKDPSGSMSACVLHQRDQRGMQVLQIPVYLTDLIRALTTVARIATHRITMCSFDEQSIIFPSCEAALLTSLG